jgi:glutathione S-transferase
VSNDETPHVTLHLCPLEVWNAQKHSGQYLPEAYLRDGFIHCTDGDDELVAVGNRYYTSDPREFVVISVDLVTNTANWKYEDPERIFPHIYGPIFPAAVVGIRPVLRDGDGTFTGIGALSS